MAQRNPVPSRKRQRSLIVIALATIAVVVAGLLYRLSQPRDIVDLVRRRGAPTLVARTVNLEIWDPDSTSVIRSRQLTVESPRDWSDQFVPAADCTLVYCDNRSFITYWEAFRDGEILARHAATFALGERVKARCYEVGADGVVNRSWSATFTFASFRKGNGQ